MRTLAETTETIEVDLWHAFLMEVTFFFKEFGTALSMAFSDVVEKAQIVKSNRDFHVKESGLHNPNLWDIIKYEISLGEEIIKLNGEDNSKYLKKDKKGTWMWKYTSTTRTVLRNLWLCDYVESLMNHLHTDEKLSLQKCAKRAYKKALAPHHPFVVKQAAKVAFLALRQKREEFFKNTDFTIEKIKEVEALISKLKKPIWDFYRENSYEKLP